MITPGPLEPFKTVAPSEEGQWICNLHFIRSVSLSHTLHLHCSQGSPRCQSCLSHNIQPMIVRRVPCLASTPSQPPCPGDKVQAPCPAQALPPIPAASPFCPLLWGCNNGQIKLTDSHRGTHTGHTSTWWHMQFQLMAASPFHRAHIVPTWAPWATISLGHVKLHL